MINKQNIQDHRCVRHLFEEQVNLTPDSIALVGFPLSVYKRANNYKPQSHSNSQVVRYTNTETSHIVAGPPFDSDNYQITYKELNDQANRLAHYLQKKGLKPDDLVGILLHRSIEVIVGILGVLKAGGAYVPFDPYYPEARLRDMLNNSRLKALLTNNEFVARFALSKYNPVRVDSEFNAFQKESNANPLHLTQASNLAYVIYTSGSTGKPKGVAMGHGPLFNLISWHRNQQGSRGLRTLSFASFSFDVSNQEMFSTFCTGGRLYLTSDRLRLAPQDLSNYIYKRRIERIFLPPTPLTHFFNVVGHEFGRGNLLEVITAGEKLQINSQIRNFFQSNKSCRLRNQYGLTETHTITDFLFTNSPHHWPSLAWIGKPIVNVKIYLLNENLQPVSTDKQGEIYVGGVSLARGYLNQPELTAQRFIPDPFSSDPGARIYRTGDLATLLSNGNIICLGRIDHQVKIRGFRIEPGEIEGVLSCYPGIRNAIVVDWIGHRNEKQLVAYLVYDPRRIPSIFELRSFLEQRLPDYMIPSSFVFVDKIPLSPNGKVNRDALPDPNITIRYADHVGPRNQVERSLVSIWSDILQIKKMGITDNFFMLGGHSLLATLLTSRIGEVMGVELPLTAVYAYPTVEALAQEIEGAQIEQNRIQEEKLEKLLDEIESMSPKELQLELDKQG